MVLNLEPLLTSMQTALEDHAWNSVSAPEFVRRGPVVPGDLALPGLGIIQDDADEDGGSLGADKYLARVRWQLGHPVGLIDPAELLATLLLYRDEMKVVALAAVDTRWGLGDMVAATWVKAWRAWTSPLPVEMAAMELALEVKVTDTYPIEDIILMPLSIRFMVRGTYFQLSSVLWPAGAFGNLRVKILEYPSLNFVGVLDNEIDSTPVFVGLTPGQGYITELQTFNASPGY